MAELAWLINHDCDFSGAQSFLVPDRSHFLDMPVLMSPAVRQALATAGQLAPVTDRPPPWQIQTHLPFNFLPPALLDTCKVGRGPRPTDSSHQLTGSGMSYKAC